MNTTGDPHGCGLCQETTAADATGAEVVLLASHGAISVGHMLLCPTRHARSVATLPAPVADLLLGRASDLAIQLADIIGEGVHVFEHGSACHGTRVACSVEHAHLHLLPSPANIDRELDTLATWHPLQWSASALSALSDGREYLLYRDPTGRARLWVTEGETIPSQLMRQLMARALGRAAEWDWREHPAVERTAQTKALTRELLDASAPLLTG